MQRLTFRARLAWWFSFILAFCLSFLTICFVVFYVGFTLINRQKFMLREASEIGEKHLVAEGKEIFFKRDEQNKTLSAYLRDENLSALVIDKKRSMVGSYGVYVGLLKEKSLGDLVKKTDLDRVLLEGKTSIGFYQLYAKRNHLVIFYPVVSEGEVVGTLILASDLNLGTETIFIFLGILGLILAISIVCGWLFTYWMISRQFRPLQRILNEMNDYDLGKVPTEYVLGGNPKDELVQLSKAFKQMVERVHETSVKQREFILNASHELRTPLTNSLLTLDLAEMDLLDSKLAEAKKSIRLVKTDLKKYGELLGGLLEIAKVDKVERKSEMVDIKKMVESVLKDYRADEREDIKIEIDQKVRLIFPENHLRIILSNLIGNAIKYTKTGDGIRIGVTGAVGIALEIENKTSLLRSVDLERIWSRHCRLGIFRKVDGNGIGLYLVKEVADHYGLKIDYSLEKGVFAVRIRGFQEI